MQVRILAGVQDAKDDHAKVRLDAVDDVALKGERADALSYLRSSAAHPRNVCRLSQELFDAVEIALRLRDAPTLERVVADRRKIGFGNRRKFEAHLGFEARTQPPKGRVAIDGHPGGDLIEALLDFGLEVRES